MRADIHDGPEQTLQSEAGYSNASPHHQVDENLLHRTAGPYSRVKTRIRAFRAYVSFHQLRTKAVNAYSRSVPILLQKSFCTCDQNFLWLYTQISCKDVEDLIV
jgi:hypothetical protein